MKRSNVLATVFITVLVLVLPFVGGGGPSPLSPSAHADSFSAGASSAGPIAAATPVAVRTIDAQQASILFVRSATPVVDVVSASATTSDSEHLAQKPVPPAPPPPAAISKGGRTSGTVARRAAAVASGTGCPSALSGGFASAPGKVSSGGVAGTTSADLASFASTYNSIRVANCLAPVPPANFRYDSCMEQRLFWMAEDPSPSAGNTWGHAGVKSIAPDPTTGLLYSDTTPSVGCDGNLAGGVGNSGSSVATKWWESPAHQAALYRPTYAGGMGGVCIYFAMSHGGGTVGNEATPFDRAAAKWSGC